MLGGEYVSYNKQEITSCKNMKLQMSEHLNEKGIKNVDLQKIKKTQAKFDSLASSTSFPPIRIAAPTWNTTATLKNIPIDSNLAWLLCALCMAMSWVIYITYYNSRVIGYILTRVLNHFIKQGYVKVGSLSVSVLSGKIMFRDVAYITEDCTWRAQDGWIIFRWWYPYVRKEISEVSARTIHRCLQQTGLSARRSLLGLPLMQNDRRLRRQRCNERRIWAAESGVFVLWGNPGIPGILNFDTRKFRGSSFKRK
ncbi:uncharacterized protein KIAA1109 [Trichonephila clavipes]|nr:uncharacterized protein KIAA1109 [Trichonephila clavipes]